MWISSYSANDPSTSCTNMVNFGPVTPEIEMWEICIFEMIRQKAAYLTEYLNSYTELIFTNISALVAVCMGIKKLTYVSRQSKGRCYGKQLILAIFADVKIDCLHSFLSCSSETKCTIALMMCAIKAPLIALQGAPKIPQHENVDFSQMREYFNTKLSSFTQHTFLHNWCIFLFTYLILC